MIPKPTLHSLAQKFRARARQAKLAAASHDKQKQWEAGSHNLGRAEAFDECAKEIEKLKK